MAAVTYNTESLIAGAIQTDQATLAADTYYKGMPLKYTADSDYWEYDSTCTGGAIYLGSSVAASRTLSVSGYDTIIVGGEVMEGGIVDDSGDALTITEDMIAAMGKLGVYIKRS